MWATLMGIPHDVSALALLLSLLPKMVFAEPTADEFAPRVCLKHSHTPRQVGLNSR